MMIKNLPLLFVLAASPPLAPALAQDPVRGGSQHEEAYGAMIGCAAFHTIESSRATDDAAEAQKATAYDFAEVAARIVLDGRIETADADLATRLREFRTELDTGDVREMAEEWTALETNCRNLYQYRNDVVEVFAATGDAKDGR